MTVTEFYASKSLLNCVRTLKIHFKNLNIRNHSNLKSKEMNLFNQTNHRLQDLRYQSRGHNWKLHRILTKTGPHQAGSRRRAKITKMVVHQPKFENRWEVSTQVCLMAVSKISSSSLRCFRSASFLEHLLRLRDNCCIINLASIPLRSSMILILRIKALSMLMILSNSSRVLLMQLLLVWIIQGSSNILTQQMSKIAQMRG